MKKRILSIVLAAVSVFSLGAFLSSCSENKIEIAIPNDTTNEARALILLEQLGYIKLNEDAGIKATIRDIEDNPYGIKIREVEAPQLPNVLKDVDYAVINSNYAIEAGLNPTDDALSVEGSYSAYGNILAVKEGNENSDKIKALAAALESQKVADYIKEKYNGQILSVVDNPGDGYDESVRLSGSVRNGRQASAKRLRLLMRKYLLLAKEILAEKGIILNIQEYTDYVVPNNVVDDGTIDANYFQHKPYLDDFNTENGTHLVSVAVIHVEPMGIYGGKQTSLDAVKK